MLYEHRIQYIVCDHESAHHTGSHCKFQILYATKFRVKIERRDFVECKCIHCRFIVPIHFLLNIVCLIVLMSLLSTFIHLCPKLKLFSQSFFFKSNAQITHRANTMAMGAQRRMNSSMSDFRKNWLQDPGTYPVIVVIAGALVICTGRCIHAFTKCPDVRITPTARKTLVRPH